MNKLLNIIRVILLILVGFLNIYSYFVKMNNLVSGGNLLYLILLFVIMFFTLKDFIKKRDINKNLVYNFISILVFLIMSFILFRLSFDSNLFFNKHTGDGFGSTFIEFRMLFLKQNMIYFNIMLVLVLLYRKINLKEGK